MISFVDAPVIVVLRDGTTAADDQPLWLLAVTGPENPHGLLLAARELVWHPLGDILVETQIDPIDESDPSESDADPSEWDTEK